MDELSGILFDTADRLFADLDEGVGDWAAMGAEQRRSGWHRIDEAGLPLALVEEEHGGLGLPLADGLELARIAGRRALPWPLVETMLASRFAAATGDTMPCGYVSDLPELDRSQLILASLAGCLQMAGMLETVLALSIAHVEERSQFGRPLARFQAIQHMLAVLAGEVAAGQAAADHALARLQGKDEEAFTAVAIARTRLGEAASRAIALAHQLHGAIGCTREHRLHRYTLGLMRHRDAIGTQTWWSRELGKAVLAQGRDGFWPLATAA